MATRITETEMTSDQTRQTAQARDEGGWAVSWLPGRILTQNQAVTAMTIAEACAAVADLHMHIDNWATELGIGGPAAVAAVTIAEAS